MFWGAPILAKAVGWTTQKRNPGHQLRIEKPIPRIGQRKIEKEILGCLDQATWSPLTALRFTAGVRYSHDHQSQAPTTCWPARSVPTLAQSAAF